PTPPGRRVRAPAGRATSGWSAQIPRWPSEITPRLEKPNGKSCVAIESGVVTRSGRNPVISAMNPSRTPPGAAGGAGVACHGRLPQRFVLRKDLPSACHSPIEADISIGQRRGHFYWGMTKTRWQLDKWFSATKLGQGPHHVSDRHPSASLRDAGPCFCTS